MPTFTSITNPRWGNSDSTFILLDVVIEGTPGTQIFCAAPYDTESYGVEMFNDAVAGEYGPVEPYVPPPVVITTMPATLSPGLEGTPYVTTLTASGGTQPYTYALAAGSTLPSGLRIQNNVIVGTPSYSDAGEYSFVVTATDANGNSGNTTITMSIYDATPVTE